MSLYSAFGTLTWFLSIGLLLVMLVALIDASLKPAVAYVAAGKQTKLLWVLVLAVTTAGTLVGQSVTSLFGIAGLIAAIVYFVDVRPAVRAVGGGGRRGGSGGSNGPYGPW